MPLGVAAARHLEVTNVVHPPNPLVGAGGEGGEGERLWVEDPRREGERAGGEIRCPYHQANLPEVDDGGDVLEDDEIEDDFKGEVDVRLRVPVAVTSAFNAEISRWDMSSVAILL